jgi:hypothetical protein
VLITGNSMVRMAPGGSGQYGCVAGGSAKKEFE